MRIFIYLTSNLYCLTPLFLNVCPLSISSSLFFSQFILRRLGCVCCNTRSSGGAVTVLGFCTQFPQGGEIGKLIESGSQIALGDRQLRNYRIAKMSRSPNRFPSSSLLSYCRNLLGYQRCSRDHRKFHGRIACPDSQMCLRGSLGCLA